MSLRASLVWRSEEDGDIELASCIGPNELRAIKDAALRLAQFAVEENVGDEVRELKFKLDYDKLKELLDYVLPELPVSSRPVLRIAGHMHAPVL